MPSRTHALCTTSERPGAPASTHTPSLLAPPSQVGSLFTAVAAFAIFGSHAPPASATESWAWSASWRRFALLCTSLPALATLLCFAFVRDALPSDDADLLGSSGQLPSPRATGGDPSCATRAESADVASRAVVVGAEAALSERHSADATADHLEQARILSCGSRSAAATRPDALPSSSRRGGALATVASSARALAPWRAALLPLMLAWFGLNFGYYGLATWVTVLLEASGVSNAYAVAVLYASANLPGNVASILLIERLGRRRLLIVAMALAAACILTLAVLEAAPDGRQSLIILFAVGFNACATAGWNSLDALSVQTFAPGVRATALGVLTGTGRLSSIAAQLVDGVLSERVPIMLAVTGTWLLLGCVGAICLDERRAVQRSTARTSRRTTGSLESIDDSPADPRPPSRPPI